MKFILMFVLFYTPFAFSHSAHEGHVGHQDEMKAEAPMSGSSIFQLGSEWKNQNGEAKKLSTLRGTPRLVVLIFTNCETACPLIVEDVKDIANEVDAKKTKKLDVSIFSIDSWRETPASLKAFAEKRKLPAHWSLFTSDAGAVAELAAVLGVRYKRLPGGDFIHSNVIFFLNGEGEVVAQKEGIKSARGDFVKAIKKNL